MKKYTILKHYPFIAQLSKAGATSNEIINLIQKKTDVVISRAFLNKTINEIKNKTAIKNSNKIICFYPFNDDDKIDYPNFAIAKHGLWFVTSEAKNELPKEWIITKDNINLLKTSNAKYIAKWILQEFEIADNELFSQENDPVTIDIQETLNHLISEVSPKSRNKYFEWIMKI